MASTPDILSKLNIGSGMNHSEVISSIVDAERIPALERIEKNKENLNRFKTLIKLYDRADIINDLA